MTKAMQTLEGAQAVSTRVHRKKLTWKKEATSVTVMLK